ncbi:metal-dependent hydrolase [Leptolyngbya sp. FACHB-1624]|uniref:metal-dependent hydrolase n=1 Tax=Leptolyngbya TaxID=47251 RepID=UPI0016874BC2|nr:metal-dependent hydrolase [Leptolyngbya sp. FACHB-1624]
MGAAEFDLRISEVSLHHKILAEADPRMKALWEWHAAKELEYKSVAFELFQPIRFRILPELQRLLKTKKGIHSFL